VVVLLEDVVLDAVDLEELLVWLGPDVEGTDGLSEGSSVGI
jgi:hypothetical protein